MKRGFILGAFMSMMAIIASAQSTSPNWTEDGHRGIDIEPRFSYLFGTGDANGSKQLSYELAIGKRLNENFFGGLVLGVLTSEDMENSDAIIPISVENQWYWPISNRFKVVGAYSIGFGINTADDIKVGKETIKMPNYLITEIAPAIQWSISHSIDVNLGFSIKAMSAVGGSGNNNSTFLYIGPKAAFNFHKADKYRTKTPVRNKGLQYTYEGGGILPVGDINNGGNVNLAFTYKTNPHLSYGIGIGIGMTDIDAQIGGENTIMTSNGKEYSHDIDSYNFTGLKFFIRGQYRLTDKRFSPFASCDLGMRFNTDDDGYLVKEIIDKTGGYSKSMLFLSPALGLSLRTTNNSYLELKVGYDLYPSLSGNTVEETTDKSTTKWFLNDVSLSAPYVMLSFTHTTALFSK